MGDRVWLFSKGLSTERPSTRLDWKRRGPFRITEKVGYSYRLDLPESIRIYPVIHADRLRLFRGNPLPGQEWEEPPPEEIDRELEYEVNEIVASRVWHGALQYRVD